MKITNNCYAILGIGYIPPWTVNSGFIIGETHTLVVDTGPSYFAAQTIFGYAKNIKPENNLIVLNTEKHMDHVGGNSYFRKMGIDIYGHEGIKRTEADLLSEKTDFNKNILNLKRREAKEEEIFYENTEVINPTTIITDETTIRLGGTIEAKIIFTPGHTATNISVFIPSDKVLYCGDCLINGYLPNLEAGEEKDWKTWVKSLDIISGLDIEYAVPGHGNIIDPSHLEASIERIRKILNNSVETGKTPTTT